MTQAQPARSWKRWAIFAGSAFVVSCLAWIGLVWLSEFGLRFSRRMGYAVAVVLCGALAFAMKMWRGEGIASNFSTSIVCFVMPALSLPAVGVMALYLACYGETACDL